MRKASSTGTISAPKVTRKRKRHVELIYDEDKQTKKRKAEAPKNWEEIYKKITKMRKETPAPVDTMGCSELADDKSTPEVKRYQSLISLMLSSQTKDQVCDKFSITFLIH
jgi:hypothetical protein